MDKVWETLLPTIPAWMLWPIAVVGLLLFLWPRLQTIWQDILPSRRAYEREKMALELRKLRFEIEALKRQHGLEDIDVEPPIPPPAPQPAPSVEERLRIPIDTELDAQLAAMERRNNVIAGAFGGLAVAVLPFVQGGLEGLLEGDKFYLLGALARCLIFAAMGAVFVRAMKPHSLQLAFVIGAAPGFFLQLSITGVEAPVSANVSPVS